jgi:hypothetical protein
VVTKCGLCGWVFCLISRLSPKKLLYRNIKERGYMGHEFASQVIVKWLISHLSESAKLV